MRLIDADKYEGAVLTTVLFDNPRLPVIKQVLIEDTPTANQDIIVRCRECLYMQAAKVNRKGFLICPASGMEITRDDFCSYAERKS